MIVERRRFARQALSEEVHCYIDGVRFDAHTIDLSLGGVFVRSKRLCAVSPGALVGLVFVRHPRMLHTTFLFGRVMRAQAEPVEGLALSWEKAVSVAPAKDLARFLETVFGIKEPMIQLEESGPRGQARNVFLFSSMTQPDSGPPSLSVSQASSTGSAELPSRAVPTLPGDPVADDAEIRQTLSGSDESVVELPDPFDVFDMGTNGLTVTARDIAAMELKIIALERDSTVPRIRDDIASAPPAAPPPHGQISQMVAREGVRVSLPAVLLLGDDKLPLTISELGMAGAFVRTAFAPLDRTAALSLLFQIPARRGPVSINCKCVLKEVVEGGHDRGPGLLLQFISTEDSDNPGVLERYIKFLQFHRLASS